MFAHSRFAFNVRFFQRFVIILNARFLCQNVDVVYKINCCNLMSCAFQKFENVRIKKNKK